MNRYYLDSLLLLITKKSRPVLLSSVVRRWDSAPGSCRSPHARPRWWHIRLEPIAGAGEKPPCFPKWWCLSFVTGSH